MKLNLLQRICIIVSLAHVFILSIPILLSKKPDVKKSTPIVVRSIIQEKRESPSQARAIAPQKTAPKTKTTIKQGPSKKADKVVKVKASKPKEESVKKKVAQEKPIYKSDADTLVVPMLVPHPTPTVSLSTEKPQHDFVLEQLERLVELPKKGNVKVQIVLSPSGKIEKIEILESDEEEISLYLLEKLLNTQLSLETNSEQNIELTVNFKGV